MSPRPQNNFSFTNDLGLAAKEEHLKSIHEDQSIGEKKLWTNHWDKEEVKGYVFMGLLYVFSCWLMSKCGLTMDMVMIALVLSTIWEVTITSRKIKYGERTLCLRKLKEDGGEMHRTQPKMDPFKEIENKFFLHVGDHIDYAVMKYVGDDVPMIVEQEYGHATMHHEAQKVEQEDEENRKWLEKNHNDLNMFRKMVLRRGDRFGRLMCGIWEAGNIHGMFFQGMCGFNPGKCFLFHIFEEVEHCALTVQCLKQNTTALERFIMFPVVIAMMLPQVFQAVLPPLYNDPSLLWKLETYPQLFWHTLKVIFGIFGMILSVLLHWVLPLPIPKCLHDMTHAYFEKECNKAGVEWEVTKKVTYPLYL